MSVTRRIRFEVFKRDGFRCTYCGSKSPNVELEADHVIPRSRGGPDSLDNLTTACTACNRGKGPIPLQEIPSGYTWRCSGGPFDGLEIKSEDEAPFYWVIREGDRDIHICPDQLTKDEDGAHFPPRGGHPGFCTRFHKSFNFSAIYDPKIIGGYIPYRNNNQIEVDLPLQWWDADRIIVELTA